MIGRLTLWLFPTDPDYPATPLQVVILTTIVVVEIVRRLVG